MSEDTKRKTGHDAHPESPTEDDVTAHSDHSDHPGTPITIGGVGGAPLIWWEDPDEGWGRGDLEEEDKP